MRKPPSRRLAYHKRHRVEKGDIVIILARGGGGMSCLHSLSHDLRSQKEGGEAKNSYFLEEIFLA